MENHKNRKQKGFTLVKEGKDWRWWSAETEEVANEVVDIVNKDEATWEEADQTVVEDAAEKKSDFSVNCVIWLLETLEA